MLSANQLVFQAQEGKIKELKEVLNTLVEFSLEASGCQKYELYQLHDQRKDFFIIEFFKSEKKHKDYLKSEAYLNLRDKIDALVEFKTVNVLKLPQCLTSLGLKKK